MSQHDRYIRDDLFDAGFAKLARGEYAEGIETLLVASGAKHLEAWGEDYDPAAGLSWLSPVCLAARGGVDGSSAPDPAALVFMGSEAEHRGFVERRTGTSPDYRVDGYANHLGEAIGYYRRAEKLGYAVATERIEALKLKLGSQDFENAEQSYLDAIGRERAHREAVVKNVRANLDRQEPPAKAPAKRGGCYVATAVYGSYDCPEVWVLRRWRDAVLLRSGPGRGLVRLYYAISPALVELFGEAEWARRFAEVPLGRLVDRLRRSGFTDSPYIDVDAHRRPQTSRLA